MMFGLTGVLAQKLSTAIPFEPLNIPSNIVLDGSINSKFTFGTGNQIATWLNDVDSSFNSTQTIVANRPLFVSGLINGWGAVQFDGVNDSVNFASNIKGCWSNKYFDYTICLLVYPQSATNTGQILGTASSITNAVGVSMDILPSGQLYIKNKSSVTTGSPPLQSLEITTPSSLFDGWHIIIWSGFNLNAFGAGFVRINGGNNIYDSIADLSQARTFAYSNVNTAVALRLGGYATNEYFKGYIADFRFIPRALNMDTIKLVEGYYATKYNLRGNLPSDHPYKNISPTIEPTAYFYRDIPTVNI